ncbi:hypothetical protein [Leptospira fluminis]|uniref:hypothetical protein n=1 Tax=Leptospira fluminis TaxID=2484979 RepID=UPI001FE58769|nr:hypothetical protein [Leptospira fluminis]
MVKEGIVKIRLTCLILAFSFSQITCSSFPRSQKSRISKDNRYFLLYQNDEGKLFITDLSVQSRYSDAIADLRKFHEEIIKPLERRFDLRLHDIDRDTTELKKDSTSIVRRLGAALAIALVVPVPGAFETTLTVGLIYVTYKKITEKPEDVLRKKHVEDLIGECQKTEKSLKNFRDDHLTRFVSKWENLFREETNHFVNSDDEADIRLLDSLREKYQLDKDLLKKSAEFELKSSAYHCNRGLLPSEEKSKPEKSGSISEKPVKK